MEWMGCTAGLRDSLLSNLFTMARNKAEYFFGCFLMGHDGPFLTFLTNGRTSQIWCESPLYITAGNAGHFAIYSN
jgi:uncharacterized membrane protein YhhN